MSNLSIDSSGNLIVASVKIENTIVIDNDKNMYASNITSSKIDTNTMTINGKLLVDNCKNITENSLNITDINIINNSGDIFIRK
jgi:hypothetical protein